jgi:hypothetical protein
MYCISQIGEKWVLYIEILFVSLLEVHTSMLLPLNLNEEFGRNYTKFTFVGECNSQPTLRHCPGVQICFFL